MTLNDLLRVQADVENYFPCFYCNLFKNTGLSIMASSLPKLAASHPSLAGYFHLFLPVWLMKNLTANKIPSKKLIKHQFPSFEWN